MKEIIFSVYEKTRQFSCQQQTEILRNSLLYEPLLSSPLLSSIIASSFLSIVAFYLLSPLFNFLFLHPFFLFH